MAYGLKYWYETLHEDGKVIRLEIYKKGYTAGSMEIGDVVQGLSLNIGGSEDNIDAPVVSTSLVMTFADAYDHPDAEVKKYGNWAEFYTPDATMWKVVLLCREGSATRTLWGGYVTPDSYEEVLQYRGSITITVRDNIGHMQDFPFDHKGENLTFRELVEAAWAKIESPMSLTWGDGWLRCEDIPAPDTVLNAIAFDGKSWGEAVEEVLYSYGAVLRFVGNNTVHVCPLRDIAEYGGQTVSNSVPVFVTGATRMLTPAVKRIEEEAKYDIGSFEIAPVKASDFTGEYDITTVVGDSATPKLYGYYINETQPGNGWCNPNPNGTLFFNQHLYTFFDEGVNDEQNMFLGCNNYRLNADVTAFGLGWYAEYSRYVLASNMSFNLTLGEAYSLLDGGVLRVIGSYQGYTHADVLVYVQQNGITQILQDDGTWGTTPNLVQVQFSGNSIEVPILLNDFRGSMCLVGIQIHGIYNKGAEYSAACYAPVHSVSLSSYSSLLATNRVNTNYEDENNIIITRDPAFAPAIDIVPIPVIIENGIFAKIGDAYKPASAWSWAGGTPQQMAVYNHLQLLCFHAKPNNVLEGNIVNGDVTRMAHIWKFEGREHLLVAGRYDMLTDYVEGAILREFARYEHLWGDVGGTQLPTVEASNRSNAQESAASSAKNTTYEQTATVNINVGGGGGSSYLRDLLDVNVENATKGSILYWDGNEWIDRGLSVLLGDYATKQYVTERDYALSEQITKILDWFTLEDGVLLTKYNLASEKEVSAKGINASQGGGTSYNRLDSWSAYDSSKAGYVLSALLGYDLHSRVTNLENAEVDLSDYYTKSETNSQIASAIGAIDLSPYATKEALSTLEGKHDALRNEFDALSNLLSSDTTDYINTWNEVVAFLDGYKDESDLATILSGMNADISSRLLASDFESWKTNVFTPTANLVANHTTRLDGLDQSILSINTRLEGVDKTIEDHIAEFIAFRANFEISDDLILVRKNFASTEEVSAKGINQGTGGGGGSSYSRLDTWEGYDKNKAGYVLSAGLGYGLKVAIDELNGYNLDNRVRSIENSYVSKDAGGVVNGGLVVSSLAIAGGSSSQFLKADGSLDSTSYLPTSGGTLSGAIQVRELYGDIWSIGGDAYHLTINRSDGWAGELAYISYIYGGSQRKAVIGAYGNTGSIDYLYLGLSERYDGNNLRISADGVSFGSNTLLHSGNHSYIIGDTYLKTSGGILNGSLQIGKDDNTAYNYLRLVRDGYEMYVNCNSYGGYIGYGAIGSESIGQLRLLTDAIIFNGNTLIHSGNFNSYAPTLTGTGASGTWGIDITGSSVSTNRFRLLSANENINLNTALVNGGMASQYASPIMYMWNNAPDASYGSVIQFSNNNTQELSGQLLWDVNHGSTTDTTRSLWWRAADVNGFTNSKWHQIAFTDSNVASAQALMHSNGTVGATVDVYGGIRLSTRGIWSADGGLALFDFDGANLNVGYSMRNSYRTDVYGNTIGFYVGDTTRMLINSAGNVTIGNGDLATAVPSCKFYVDGKIVGKDEINLFQPYSTVRLTQYITDGIGRIYTYDDMEGYCDTYIGRNDGDALVVKANGNVGIGTSLPSETLDVDGNTRVRGDIVTNQITIGGATLSWENGALKVNTSFYSEKEISAKGLSTGGGSGASYNRLDAWGDYDSSKAGYVLSAYLGDDLNTRLSSLSGVVDTHTSRLSSLENAGYITSSALSGYLPLSGGTINGTIKIHNVAGAYNSVIEFSNTSSYLGALGVSSYNRPVFYNGAVYEDILTTSGGTINGKLTLKPQGYHAIDIVSPDNALAQITISTNDTLRGIVQYNSNFGFGFHHEGRGGIYVAADGTPTYVDSSLAKLPLIHEGNCDMYSLSVWGGTLKGNLILSESYLKITAYGKEYGYNVNAGNGEPIYLKDDTWRTIIHSGNIGSQSVASADKASFLTRGSGDIPANDRGSLDYTYALYTGGWANSALGYASTYGTYIDLSGYATWYHRLAFNTTGEIEHFMGINTTTLTKVGSLAYLSSNVASATKLQTPRTIWGQSFDGTGDVNGVFYDVSGIEFLNPVSNKYLIIGQGFAKNGMSAYLDGNNVYLRYGTATAIGFILNSSGNVTIGATDLTSSSYRLYVDGTGYFSGALTANGGLTVNGILTVGGASIHPTANNPYFQLYQNNNYWYWQADNSYTYIGGTMSKALRIDQDGNTLIRGSLGVDALLTASNGLTVSKGISATDGIVSDWITAANITANTSASIAALTVSGLSNLTGGIATNDIHGNGQSLYLGNASNNAYIKVRENMVGSSSMWSIPRDGKATFTSLTTPTLSVTGSATIASVTIEAGNATLSNLTVNTAATLKQLVVGIDGMSCNAPATFNDFIYGSSITPRTDNYYVLGNNNYKWYAVTAYNVNVHDAITIEAGKELRFKDDNGVVHTLKYDSTKQAFVFDGNVNATGEMSAKKLNA